MNHTTVVTKVILYCDCFFRFPIIIYLMSVYWLEYLRIQMCTNVSTFNKLFNYLEDKALQVRLRTIL